MPAAKPAQIKVPSDVHIPSQRARIFARAAGWADVRAASNAAEILVFDEIGPYGVSAAQFHASLQAAKGKNVVVKIDSPGGDAFSGITMFNDLCSYEGDVRVEIMGLAASAASIVAMGGNTIAIAENACLMIHRSWGMTIGNTNDHADQAELLSEVDRALAVTYANRTGLPIDRVLTMMDDQTWMWGPQAKELGFATEMLESTGGAPAARFDLSAYRNVPDGLSGAPARAEIRSRADLEELLLGGGVRNRAARIIAKAGFAALNGDSQGSNQEFANFTNRVAQAAAELKDMRK